MSPRSSARRQPLPDLAKVWHEFFYNHGMAKEHAEERDAAKATLKKWFSSGDPRFYADENGSKFFDLPEVLEIGGRKYDGLENRRRAKQELDVDRVEAWLDDQTEKQRDGLSKEIFNTIATVDLSRLPASVAAQVLAAATDVDVQLDEANLYALQQKGIIPEEMLDPNNEDGFIVTTVEWALYPKMAL